MYTLKFLPHIILKRFTQLAVGTSRMTELKHFLRNFGESIQCYIKRSDI